MLSRLLVENGDPLEAIRLFDRSWGTPDGKKGHAANAELTVAKFVADGITQQRHRIEEHDTR